MLNIDEVKKEFGDCDWMRAVLNDYTVNAVLWLINRVETLEGEGEICMTCRKAIKQWNNEISNKDIEEAVNVMIADEIKTKDVTCPKCGEPYPVLHCENCGHNWEED